MSLTMLERIARALSIDVAELMKDKTHGGRDSMNWAKNLTVLMERPGSYRIARNGRALPNRRGWWNLYRTRADAARALADMRRGARPW